jgi:hypothetical protein
MDVLNLTANKDMRSYFTGLHRPCPSNLCDGFLTEYEQESWDPFKAFLYCPDCESRLRLYKRKT